MWRRPIYDILNTILYELLISTVYTRLSMYVYNVIIKGSRLWQNALSEREIDYANIFYMEKRKHVDLLDISFFW